MKKSAAIFAFLAAVFFAAALFLALPDVPAEEKGQPYALAVKTRLGGKIHSMCIGGGLLYAASSDGKIWALDFSGKRVFETSFGGYAGSGVSFFGGRIFIADDEGEVFAFDAGDGKQLWTFRAGDKIAGSFSSFGEMLLFASYDRHMYALDAESGALLFKVESGEAVNGSVEVSDGLAYFGDCGGSLSCVDLAAGKLLWRSDFGTYIPMTPRADSGVVAAGAHSGMAKGYNAKDGSLLWTAEGMGVQPSSDFWAFGGRIYFMKDGGSLGNAAISDASGLKEAPFGEGGALLVSDKSLLLSFSEAGMARVFDPSSMSEIFRFYCGVPISAGSIMGDFWAVADSDSAVYIFKRSE